MKAEHLSQIQAAVAAVKERKTIRRFYFVACGGSQASMMPIQYMFDRETSIPSAIYTSNEFVKGNTEGAGRYLRCINYFPFRKYTRDCQSSRACKGEGSSFHFSDQPC